MNRYDTDIKNLTCSCKDWKKRRQKYPLDDPRRLCKHLIVNLDLNNLPNQIQIFRESIAFYQSKGWGFKIDFKEIVKLPENNLIVLSDSDWMDVFDSNGNRYGYLNNNYSGNSYWANNNKPAGYEEVESYFLGIYKTIPLGLQDHEKSNLIDYIKQVIPSKQGFYIYIDDDQYIPSPEGRYYSLIDLESPYDEENEVRSIIVRNHEIIIEMYLGKTFTYNRDYEYAKRMHDQTELEIELHQAEQQNIYDAELRVKTQKAKEKGYLYEIRGTDYSEAIENTPNKEATEHYVKHLDSLDDFSKKFGTLESLLRPKSKHVTKGKFYRVLKHLNMVTRMPELNLNNWIVINEGLKYGINMTKESRYFSEVIPDWYEVKKIEQINFELITDTDRSNMKMTKPMWERDSFQSLYDIVEGQLEKEKVVNTKRPVPTNGREKWLEHVSCHTCGSKNIHKKGKRQRKEDQVQRYQCMDCKSVFQEKILEKLIEKEVDYFSHNLEDKKPMKALNEQSQKTIVKDEKSSSSFIRRIFNFIKNR